ncbi:MAG: hypothetical protein RBQ71_02275 [Acholeplasmataceae bacterium]|jgi:hypothetical protein|nr:hypothetical protein [Acholeplasmataceae bacterium]
MKKSEFSEKFFEFTVNHELLNKYNVDIYIPSQYEEDDLGWDIGFTDYHQLYFFQYKIVQKYDRNPIGLIGDSYKFDLHKNSRGVFKQHNLLRSLNAMGFIARYVVPDYIEINTLKKLLYSNNVFSKVRFITPGILSTKRSHYINFDSTQVFQHSKDQVKLETSPLNEIFEYADYAIVKDWTVDKQKLLQTIREDSILMTINKDANEDVLINKYLYTNKIIMIALKGKKDDQ